MPYHEWIIALFSVFAAGSSVLSKRREWFSMLAWLNVGVFYMMAYYNLLSSDTLHEYAHWNWVILAASYIVPFILEGIKANWGDMSTDDLYKWITGIVLFLGCVGTLYNLASSARKDTVKALSDMVDRLEKKVKAIEQERDDLQNWAQRLVKQIVEAGMQPEPFKMPHEHRVHTQE